MTLTASDLLNIVKRARPLGERSNASASDSDRAMPAWAETLDGALQMAWETLKANHSLLLRPDEPVPFEDIYLPFILYARQELIAQAGDAHQVLSPEAHTALERGLLDRLSGLASLAVGHNFIIARAMPALLDSNTNSASDGVYGEFVENMLKKGGLEQLFIEFPVLARLVGTVTRHWIEANAEFLARLRIDLPAIQQTFQSEQELGTVIDIETELSDPHNGGRGVLIPTFISGLKVVYKPKDLGMQEAFFALLDWLMDNGPPLDLKTLKIIKRSNYGWVEYAEHQPCSNMAEAQDYYRRTGMLLCLLYVLHGTDFHSGNVIACGQYPMLVDMEMLFSIQYQMDAARITDNSPAAMRWKSVLSNGLLPGWDETLRGHKIDVNALASGGEQEVPVGVADWKNINRDDMTLAYRLAKIGEANNRPMLDGSILLAQDYVEVIVDGFATMYRLLVKRCPELLAKDGPLATFRGQRVRVLARSTMIYYALLLALQHPRFLRDGAARSNQMDVMKAAIDESGANQRFLPIIESEQRTLEMLDIPLFVVRSDSKDLQLATGQTIEGFFADAGFASVVTGLIMLTDDDMQRQVGLIRESLLDN